MIIDTKKITELLHEILEHQVANRHDPDFEFYICYTYPKGQMPPWVKKAERAILELQDDR